MFIIHLFLGERAYGSLANAAISNQFSANSKENEEKPRPG
jgi:hypothetical protein